MSKSTKFNTEWLKDPQFSSWVGVDPNSNTKARCILCGVKFELGNMGRQALISHAKGKKHELKVNITCKVKQENKSLDMFVVKHEASGTTHKEQGNKDSTVNIGQLVIPVPPPPTSDQTLKPSSSSSVVMSNFVTNDDVLSAEIIWAIKTVVSHYSCSSSSNTNTLFQKMFPDSVIAKKFSCGETKCSYLIQFGLAPYFKTDLANKVQKPETIFVVSFDESLNKVLQEEQMDLLLRFWDEELNRVVTRYYDSVFLGHTRAEDLLGKFKTGLSKLNARNMLQISMDGPSTNWKFLDLLVQDREESEPNIPSLINVGSCGLHIVHGAFKYGATKAGWKADGVMRSLFNCFNDSPARREDYLTANGGDAKFGLKFCSTRWLEDVPVAERAICIWPCVQKYVAATLKLSKSKRPTCQSYINLCEYVDDPLVLAKLNFFVCIAKVLMPYLELFQTDKPMMPYISDELQKILTNLLNRFVKKSVLDTTRNIVKVDFNKKENIVSPDKVDVGFAAKQVVDDAEKSKKASKLQVYEFHQECITFLQKMTEKILERCPLKFATIRALNAIDPKFIASHPEKAIEKMETILQKLMNTKWLSPTKCDDALQEFKLWVREMELHNPSVLKEFNFKGNRLDDFYYSYMGNHEQYSTLWYAVKLLLILSHGQSSVERGFSTNKDILKNNMAKEKLTAYRQVHDGLMHIPKPKTEDDPAKVKEDENKFDIAKVTVSKKMLDSCRSARTRYSHHMEDEQKKKAASREELRRKSVQDELTVMKSNKRKLESSVDVLLREADEFAQQAEKKLKMDLIVKSNAFRSKAKEKRIEIEEASKQIEKLEKKLQEI